ncbi:MAG TPA: hypothetical protein VHK89_02390, partial [Actinomycetota bacterium]|nr:hypothetical protein [Actinomycetota bacterium]
PSESPAALGTAQICLWVDEENDASYHPHVNVEHDGALCDQETAGGAENDNRTDVVSVTWKLRRSVSLVASKRSVARGGSVTLRGAVARTTTAAVQAPASTCVAGQTVLIKRDVLRDGNPAFVDFKTVRTGPAGGYTTSFKVWSAARYKAVVRTTARCFGASSALKTVSVG